MEARKQLTNENREFALGLDEGFQDGYKQGLQDGWAHGWDEGYSEAMKRMAVKSGDLEK